MKNSNFKIFLGLGTLLLLAFGLSSSVLAGPGPQYWTQMEKIRSENAAKSTVVAKAPATPTPPAVSCAACKTTPIRVYHPEGAAGKIPARYETIGSKHSCDACGGSITVVQGKMTNDMKTNCAICAKAKSACCTTGK